MKDKKDEKPLPVDVLNPDSEIPPDADLEEKFNDFWKKNGVGIFGGIIVGAVGVLGVQGYQYWKTEKESSVQTDFANAISIEDKVSFAEANDGHMLSGLALIEVADASFEASEFAEARAKYSDAKALLEGTQLSSRAQLGEAMSFIGEGNLEAGTAVLGGITANGSALDQIRGEAAYHLAVLQWEQGSADVALETLAIIENLETAGIWGMKARALQERISAL